MTQKIQIRRGTKSALNGITLSNAELGYTTDTNKVYVGTGVSPSAGGHHLVGSAITGSTSGRPIPEIENRFYFDIDAEILYLDDGIDWNEISNGGVSYTSGSGISITSGASGERISADIGAGIEIDNNEVEFKLSNLPSPSTVYYPFYPPSGSILVQEWSRKCPLIIQSSQFDDDLVNFPLMLVKETLPLEIFDADGEYCAQNGGKDIWFSSDSEGNTKLPCEIKLFNTDDNPDNGKAVIWVNVPQISSTTNTIIYIWYNQSERVQPDRDSTYGSENVWDSNYFAVYHFNETTGLLIDSTSHNNNGTCTGGFDTPKRTNDGLTGNSYHFNNSEYITLPDGPDFRPNYVTIEVSTHVETQLDTGWTRIFDRHNVSINHGYALTVASSDHANEGIVFTECHPGPVGAIRQVLSNDRLAGDENWHGLVSSMGDGSSKFFTDGNYDNISSAGSGPIIQETSRQPMIGNGSHSSAQLFTGYISELRLSGVDRSVAWSKAISNNLKNPLLFIVIGDHGDEDVNGCFIKDSIYGMNVKVDGESIIQDPLNNYRLKINILDGGDFI